MAARNKHSGNGQGQGGSLWVSNASLAILQVCCSLAMVANKFALDSGMPPGVLLIYRSVFGLAFLVPVSYFVDREARSSFDWKTLCTFAAGVGFLGCAAEFLTLYGLAIGTASLGVVIPITVPVFVFFISAVFRLEEVDIRRRDGQAKLGGVASAVAGLALMSFYRGPVILGKTIPKDAAPGNHGVDSDQNYGSQSIASFLSLGLGGPSSSWQIGLMLLLLSGFLFSAIYCIQVIVIKRFPAPLSVATVTILFGSVIAGAAAVGGNFSASAWVIPGYEVFASVLYLGIIYTGVTVALQIWTLQRSGPLLVASYNPFQSLCTTVFSYLLLGDPLHLGTVLGALFIINGLFLVTWGRYKYHKEVDPSATPLLFEEPVLDVPPVAV